MSTVNPAVLSVVVEHYEQAACWADGPETGWADLEIDGSFHEQALKDCEKLLQLMTIADIPLSNLERFGHDFWLTRQGHGAGFWDGDWPEYGDWITDIIKRAFSELSAWTEEGYFGSE
jgi:hypothetical protein